jgi:AAA ATPase domain
VTAASDGGALVERASVLAVLDGWLEDVRRSQDGRFVLVAGEAGVGKTALLASFCAGADSVPALWGWCDPLATPAPLGPLADVAAGLGASAAAVLAGRARPYEVAQALLEDLGRERVSIVAVEDLHWPTREASTRSHTWRGGSSGHPRS